MIIKIPPEILGFTMPIMNNHISLLCNYLVKKRIIDDVSCKELCGPFCENNDLIVESNTFYQKKIVDFCANYPHEKISLNIQNLDISNFSVLELGALIQDNHIKKLQFIFQYHQAIYPLAEVNVYLNSYIYFEIEPTLFKNIENSSYIFCVEYHLNQIIQTIKYFFPSIKKPKKITVCFPEPKDSQIFHSFFNCEVIFNSTKNQVFFDIPKSCLIRKSQPLSYDEVNKKIISLVKNMQPKVCNETNLKSKIYSILIQSGNNIPDEITIANQLNIHIRTLRRKLKLENETFRNLVKNYKMHKGIDLLIHSNLTYKEIAFTLGFKSFSSFSKAFKTWTKRTPQEFRDQCN
ncbi:helix-turn-helix transcriptional regulator [Acinetobacter pittii]|uniref:helix-turn-helix domain-containing protein n=1 Tax=Acinetobacter pittii TaxID=48296 RepID=UPI0024DEFD7D|nr:helix-turn-helix transcriptional regulator [Acinetobacter pittii]